MGLKQQILDAKDRPVAPVEIDNWPPVFVRTLSVKELEQLTALDAGEKFEAESLATICALVLSDEAGDRVFTDDDAPMLLHKSFDALQKIVDAALKHNKLAEEPKPEGDEEGNPD